MYYNRILLNNVTRLRSFCYDKKQDTMHIFYFDTTGKN